MSVPSEYPRVSDVPADGKYYFSSRVFLLGILPIDSHKFGLRAVDPPNYFDERSENKMMRFWKPKRTVSAVNNGVLVTDHCGFEPRLAVLGGYYSGFTATFLVQGIEGLPASLSANETKGRTPVLSLIHI